MFVLGLSTKADQVALTAEVTEGGSAAGMQAWKDCVPIFTYAANQPFSTIFVPSADLVCYSWFINRSLDLHRPTLLVGPSGAGKTSIIEACQADAVSARGAETISMVFSAKTSCAVARMVMEESLEKKTRTTWGSAQGKQIVMFVDDINMPQREQFGAQPPVELLRTLQVCSHCVLSAVMGCPEEVSSCCA